MGLLSRLGARGVRALRSGEMFGSPVANSGDNFVLGGMGKFSSTTPTDIAQRIRGYQSAEARGLGGDAMQFHIQKEMLAQQLSGGDPEIMAMVRAASTPQELDEIVTTLPLPRVRTPDPRTERYGLVPHTPSDLVDVVERGRRRSYY